MVTVRHADGQFSCGEGRIVLPELPTLLDIKIRLHSQSESFMGNLMRSALCGIYCRPLLVGYALLGWELALLSWTRTQWIQDEWDLWGSSSCEEIHWLSKLSFAFCPIKLVNDEGSVRATVEAAAADQENNCSCYCGIFSSLSHGIGSHHVVHDQKILCTCVETL